MSSSTPMIDKIMTAAIKSDASDIHLAVGVPPVFRVHGALRRLETKVLEASDTNAFVKSLASERFQLQLSETGSCNFSFEYEERAFRVNVAQERLGVNLTLRLISNSIKTPQQLGLAPSVLEAVRKPRGLVLATGATGSGKSTTLAALVDMLARESGVRIVTIEQPVEYRFSHHEHSVVTQREVPLHTRDFSDAVVDALRQDPDVIMVGELRTCAEMRVALSAAETGHIVLSTLHTNSASETVDRLVGSFPYDEQSAIRMQLSLSLNAVVSQQLVPRAEGEGRVMVHEVLTMNPGVRNLIREGHTPRIISSIQTGAKDGMVMFDDHLFERYQQGLISKQTGMSFARDKAEFAKRLASRGRDEE